MVGVHPAAAGPATAELPRAFLLSGTAMANPVSNAAFAPGRDALAAAPFVGHLSIAGAELRMLPALSSAVIRGRDARLFPSIELTLHTIGERLVPVERGSMVHESRGAQVASYWRVVPEVGRVWREPGDGEWSRAALPLMLVNDTENHAHQGLATFLYRRGRVSAMQLQFVQQTAPYLIKPHFIAWGRAHVTLGRADPAPIRSDEEAFDAEQAAQLPTAPWSVLVVQLPAGTLDGFGGPLKPEWRVATALVRDGTIYYSASDTPQGPYPYTLQMRFGVRSVMKSVAAPLAVLRLAELYGPYVLELKIGDYVPGLDPKYREVRLVDALGMASGMGGSGSLRTHPNDIFDGYLDAHYDEWYLAPSQAEKLKIIETYLRPYPWEPGRVVRYRDQDVYLAGAALQSFLQSVQGPTADLWEFVQREVLARIGIAHIPVVRTQEAGDREGLVWCNAGLYPTLDDLAKIALLYQHHGEAAGRQVLHRELTEALLAGRWALRKTEDNSLGGQIRVPEDQAGGLYWLGFHYKQYETLRDHRKLFLPTMSGSGESEVVLYPNGLVSIRIGKAGGLPKGTVTLSEDTFATIRAVDRLAPL